MKSLLVLVLILGWSVHGWTDEGERILKPKATASAKEKAKRAPQELRPDIKELKTVEPLREEAVPSTPTATTVGPPLPPARPEPSFHAIFDLLLAYQPGRTDFSFVNLHPLLLFEIVPSEEMRFGFEVNPAPRYFELAWDLNSALTLKMGKIWVPFDETGPHFLFGGMTSLSRLRLGNQAFLPDVWADLGVGLKAKYRSPRFSVEAQWYVVNGFKDGGVDPVTGGAYPAVDDASIAVTRTDNNTDKAVGMRIRALFGGIMALGVSAYTGRWTADSLDPRSLYLLGADAQVYLGLGELHVGGLWGPIELYPTGTAYRQGAYAELSRRFGPKSEWKVLSRVGWTDTDDRVVDTNDLFTVGGAIRYRPNFVEWSLEHTQDLHQVDGKTGYSFTGIRTFIQL